MTAEVIKRVSGQASAYTVLAKRLDPDEHPDLEAAGYHSPATMYVVMTGGQVWAHYDTHKLIREMPGQNDWLIDQLDDLALDLREQEDNGDSYDALKPVQLGPDQIRDLVFSGVTADVNPAVTLTDAGQKAVDDLRGGRDD